VAKAGGSAFSTAATVGDDRRPVDKSRRARSTAQRLAGIGQSRRNSAPRGRAGRWRVAKLVPETVLLPEGPILHGYCAWVVFEVFYWRLWAARSES